MRYFFHIAYQGDKYQGWQRQTNALGIQQIIEEVLSEVWNRPVLASGCGRTDAGVHATQFFFYSQLPEGLPENVIYILNRRLPQDISVFDIIPVPDNAHPQYDATARTYDYFLHTNKEAGLAGISTWYTEK
ncbi:MAG: tRNA pseudouridine(38-40) synthase TruA, partial [Bacteroidota bacterium]